MDLILYSLSVGLLLLNKAYVGFSQSNDLTRIECYPEASYLFGASLSQKCHDRNCVYSESSIANVPWCFYPQDTYGYTMTNSLKTPNGYTISLKRLTKYKSPFPNPIDNLKMTITFMSKSILNFKIIDVSNHRYEVPIELNDIKDELTNELNADYSFLFENRPNDAVFTFKIVRKSSGLTLFDTNLGGLVFCDQYLQIVTRLPSNSHVYGFGENNHPSLAHDYNFKSWGIFARDQSTAWGENTNQYGAQPFYQVMEEDGNSHGVLFLNSNAMDYSFTPLPSLILRTIGGIFDFYIFVGPHPEEVSQQYTSLVGRPFMPPYYALGFQLCRWGYKDLADMRRIVERNLAAGLPLDVQYADIEHYKDNMDFTIDPIKFGQLPAYFKELQSRGMHVAIILDPALVISRQNTNYKPYIDGYQSDVYIKWPSGMSPDFNETNSNAMVGYCWPNDKVVYPDFMNNRTRQWWLQTIVDYRKVNITFDALWIDMNEPVVFNTNEEKPWNWPSDRYPFWTLKCPKNSLDDPPYRTKAVYRWDEYNKPQRLSQTTLCMIGLHNDGQYKHYDVHNLYGLSEAIVTQEAARQATGKRSFVLTRSNYIGVGKYAGHWLGDNDASWKDLQRSIIGLIEYNMFGVPYVGADICGFFNYPDEELCMRWLQLGAFYPFSRNHNAENLPDQDPAAYSQQLIDSTIKALNVRYTLLPYLYTLFHNAHTKGNLVVKGLFQEFPCDKISRTIDRQFLLGSSLLISPVLDRGRTSVDAYFPSDSKWFSYYDGSVQNTNAGKWTILDAPINFIPVHVRGGHIVPTQEPANNTYYSRKNSFGLIIALNEVQEANGELFYDDGDSLNTIESGQYFYANFIFKTDELSMQIITNPTDLMNNLKLDTIRLFGLSAKTISSVSLMTSANRALQTLDINNIQLNQFGELTLKNVGLRMHSDFKIKFYLQNLTQVAPLEQINLNDEKLRVDCHPEPNSDETSCRSRGCTWLPSATQGIPWCFINKYRIGYKVKSNAIVTQETARNRIIAKYDIIKVDSLSFYGQDIKNLSIQVEKKGAKQLRIRIRDSDRDRYEVPVPTNWANDDVQDDQDANVNNNDFDVHVENDAYGRFILEVYRKSSGARLISTREYAEGFVYSDKFIQFYARLASESVYGWGENTHQSFRHKFNLNSPLYPMFARDEPPLGGTNALYGVHPFYISIEDDGCTHGLLILNSNAQEYKLTALKTLIYRTLGGILDIYMFSGPTPEDVIRQYTHFIGKPFLPPYYALGFQLCRYGYNNLANLKAAVDRTLAARIPLDIQYADIDHFDRNLDFTYDKTKFANLPTYIDQLKTQGIKFIIIIDPALITNEPNYGPYIRGQSKQDVWIKWPRTLNPQSSETGNQNMLGYVWPQGKVVFPDFFQNKTQQWWTEEIKLFYETTIKFDGLWIDMNEPANFGTNNNRPFNLASQEPDWSLKCPTNEYDDPPYRTNAAFGDRISDKTLCMIGEQSNGHQTFKHYDVHNLYGWTESIATFNALKVTRPTKRPLVISRSTFPSSGRYVGHWLGDNESVWKQLKYNLIGLLEFNLFGIPYVGADICGFFGDASSELCTRWMQLGAFNPFFRNHNSINQRDQDPGFYGPVIADRIRKVIETRYTLLPYLYSLFYDVHLHGGTVVRSLAHEFPRDKVTHDLDEQFLWGSALLISPVLEEASAQKLAYFPFNTKWYDFYTGVEQPISGFVTLNAPLDYIPLHVKGGHILPLQDSALNTELSRKTPFTLMVAPDGNGRARGLLYWDDGESIDSVTANKYNLFRFDFDGQTGFLNIRLEESNYSPFITNDLNVVRIFGVRAGPSVIQVNGLQFHTKFSFNSTTKVLEIYDLNIRFNKFIYLRLL